MSSGADRVTRADAEDFLFAESRLLEAGKLQEWLGFFEPGGRYQIPTTDAPIGAVPERVQFFIADDWDLLNARVTRLLSRNAHAENPRSRTHRMISNVAVSTLGTDEVNVHASFIVHRIRDGRMDPYLGHYDHVLAVTPEGLRFRLRKTTLAHEQLRPGGRLSFIL
jgi:p-cumate 2,3-dioxygenase beta subunit